MGVKVVITQGVDAEGAVFIQSEKTVLMGHMRPARDLRMMIHNISNVKCVFYSK